MFDEYDIKTAKDIEDILKDFISVTLQEMIEFKMDEHLGYHEYECSVYSAAPEPAARCFRASLSLL